MVALFTRRAGIRGRCSLAFFTVGQTSCPSEEKVSPPRWVLSSMSGLESPQSGPKVLGALMEITEEQQEESLPPTCLHNLLRLSLSRLLALGAGDAKKEAVSAAKVVPTQRNVLGSASARLIRNAYSTAPSSTRLASLGSLSPPEP